MDTKTRILFICTGNSCRSQMAEGWARALKGDIFEVYSAGVETHGLNPHAVTVMREAGVEISGHTSDNIRDYLDAGLDWVVTVCDHASETCPVFPGRVKRMHVSFPDPHALARELAVKGATEEEQLDCYRQVRDRIRAFVETLPDSLQES